MNSAKRKVLRDVKILEALDKIGTMRIVSHHLEALRDISREHKSDPTLKKLFDMVEGFFVWGYTDRFAQEVLSINTEDYAYLRHVDDLIVEEATSRGVEFTEDQIDHGEIPDEEPLDLVMRIREPEERHWHAVTAKLMDAECKLDHVKNILRNLDEYFHMSLKEDGPQYTTTLQDMNKFLKLAGNSYDETYRPEYNPLEEFASELVWSGRCTYENQAPPADGGYPNCWNAGEFTHGGSPCTWCKAMMITEPYKHDHPSKFQHPQKTC